MSEAEQNPWLATRTRTGAEYDAPYALRAQAGEDIHGEANLITELLQATASAGKQSVLDGGCGTGRTAIELARRGYDIVGVDLDDVMLSEARKKAPQLEWHLADLTTIDLQRHFDAIVLAGNVMIYVTPGTEQAIVHNVAHHLRPGGFFLAAFELNPYPWTKLTLPLFESLAADVGLQMTARWSTWDKDDWQAGDTYLVSLHHKPVAKAP